MANYVGDSNYYAGSLVEQIISEEAVIKVLDTNRVLPLVKYLSKDVGDSFSVPVWEAGAASAFAEVTVKTTGAAAVEIDSAKVNIPCKDYGFYMPIYDEANDSSLEDLNMIVGGQAGNLASGGIETLLCALFDSFSATAGSSTAAITLDTLYSAIEQLESAGAIGEYGCVLHPKQMLGTYGLLNDVVTSAQFGGATNKQNEALDVGAIGDIAGVSLATSRNCATATKSHFGALFSKEALAFAAVNPLVRIELERESKLFRTDLVARVFGDAAILVNAYGVELQTKTSA